MSDTSYVYRCFAADDELLYIGMTADVEQRMSYHRSRAPWFGLVDRIEIEEYSTRLESARAELRAIRTERPTHNKAGNTQPRHPITEPVPVVPEFHTTASIARAAGVTPSAISRMVSRGEISPAGRLPGLRGAFLFRSDEVDRWLSATGRAA